jgi:hypothetical protein
MWRILIFTSLVASSCVLANVIENKVPKGALMLYAISVVTAAILFAIKYFEDR